MPRTSNTRNTLRQLTSELCEQPQDWANGYRTFMRKLGTTAQTYDTYMNAAVTSAGYRRDSTLTREEAIARNTDTALLIADQLAENELIEPKKTIDAVALGYIPSWEQSDYLQFFFGVMARPNVAYIDDIADEMRTSHDYDLEIFNNHELSNEERFPHYLGLTAHFWETVQQVPHHPIDRMIESFDRTMTLGGRAEEQLAIQMGTRILQPVLLTETTSFIGASISPELREHYQRLAWLNADLFARPTSTHLSLKQIVPPQTHTS